MGRFSWPVVAAGSAELALVADGVGSVLSEMDVEVFVCAESVELAPVPETVVVVTLRSVVRSTDPTLVDGVVLVPSELEV
ncbi:hypothetical protein [Mycolicibacterium sp.]|uniref:hypothetical protein n=1 Tax=Mycolicibacterium sp. TaxID=2320850 RepID=UPI0037C951F7